MTTRAANPARVPSSAGAELLAAAAGLLALLALLTATTGLWPLGWLAGAAFGTGLFVLLVRALRRGAWPGSLGPANLVTLTRAVLAAGITALAADALTHPPATAAIAGTATIALALDWVDGRVARRTGWVSALGARFDMEVDAALIAVLSVLVADTLGWWVLLIGAMRYLFVIAGWLTPWLRGRLTPNRSRKVVAAIQGITLVIAAATLLPSWLSMALVALALTSLTWSFGRDVHTLWRARGQVSR